MSPTHSYQDKSWCCFKAFSLASYRGEGQRVNPQTEKKKPLPPMNVSSQETGYARVTVYVRMLYVCIHVCMFLHVRASVCELECCICIYVCLRVVNVCLRVCEDSVCEFMHIRLCPFRPL